MAIRAIGAALALIRDHRQGAVSVIGAFSMSGLLAVAALSVDINRGLSQRVRNQSVADMAALGAALAYQASSRNSAVLTPTAQDIAKANGLDPGGVTASVVNDMPTSGAQSVRVTVASTLPVALGHALGLTGTYRVSATSYASLATGQTGTKVCFLALSASGTGISTSGGATINTPNCAVAAVADVNNGGTGITADKIISGTGSVINDWGTLTANLINYATTFTNPGWNSKIPAADKIVKQANTLTDPLANSGDLSAARALLGTYAAPASLVNPTTPSGGTVKDWTFSGSPSATVAAYRVGTTNQFNVPSGTYSIKKLTVAGGYNVTFQGSSTVTVNNSVSIGGGCVVNFGNMNLKVNGGFTSGSSGVTFGDGTIEIGSGTITFSGTNVIGAGNVTLAGDVTVGGGSSLTMGAGNHAFGSLAVDGWAKLGAGDLDVVSGITIAGGSTLAAGNGSYRIGKKVSSGEAIKLSGSAVMIMGDGPFSANGHVSTAGGSRIVFGKTANHYINGNMTIAGSALFGTSRYTINGNFSNGSGGTTWPYTSTVTGESYGSTLEGTSVSGYDMAGINVTFILSGTLTLGGGAKTILVANAATVTGGAIADVLIDSLTTSATSWGQGANNLFVGAVHLPNSAVTMSGGTATLSGGQCFMLIAKTITASGGATAGSACTSIDAAFGGSGGSTTINLVQ